MKIERARYSNLGEVTVTIDGNELSLGLKYPFTQSGVAVLIGNDPKGDAWVAANGSFSEWGNIQIPMFFKNSTLVAIAALAYHGKLTEGDVEIPSADKTRAVLAEYQIPIL